MTQTLTSPGGGSLAIAGGRNATLLPAPHGSEPPGHPPDTPFSTVLDDHQARTAIAEGHQQKRRDASHGPAVDNDGREPAVDRDRRDADGAKTDPADNDRAKPAVPVSTDASALAALLGGVPLPAGVTLTAAAMSDAPTTGSSTSATPGIAGLSAAAVADATAAPMPTGPAVPAAATALPLRPPIPGASQSDLVPGATPSVAADTSAEQTVLSAAPVSNAAARATRLADVLQSATARPGGESAAVTPSQAAATPPAATVAGAAGRSFGQAADHGAANGSAPQPAVVAGPQPTASVQGGTPAAATAPAHGVGLEHAVETVRLALRAAADRGVTHARISLTPRELGSIEVHLRQTADGLVARVVAEHAAAAQLLQNAGADLRRQLESQGLTLLRLDIGASGEQGGGARANGGSGFGANAGNGRNGSGSDTDPLAPPDGTTDQTSTTTTLALPNGALVDVLA